MITQRPLEFRLYAMIIVCLLSFKINLWAVETYDCPLVGIGTSYPNPFSPDGNATVTPAHGSLLSLNLSGGTATQTSGIWELGATGGASISLLGLGLLESAPTTKLAGGDLEFDITQKPDSLLGYLGTGLAITYQWSAAGTFSSPESLQLKPYSAYQVTFDVDGSNGLLKTVLGLVPSFSFQLLDGAGTPVAFETHGTLINIIGLLGTGVPTGTITLKFSTGSSVPAGPIKMVFKAKALVGAGALGLGKDFATVTNLKLRSNTCLSIGDLVWRDENANGKKDAVEIGISGLTPELYYTLDGVAGNADDMLWGSTTTDSAGKYKFQKLPPGKYFVKMTTPAAYPLSSEPVVALDNSVNNDNNGTQPGGQGTALFSPVVQLVEDNESVTDGDTDSCSDLTIDFGLKECDIIIITPPVLPPGNVNSAYSQPMTATGGSGSYSWSMTGGSLPTGLTFSVTGIVSGIPLIEGSFLFIAKAVDTHGCIGMQAVSVTIRPIPIVHALAKDSAGRYLAAGEFYEVAGVSRVNLVRLNRDGSVDETFAPSAPNGPVYCIEIRGSAIYVGGGFTEWGGDSQRYLVKLNDDGSRDSGFSVSGFSAGVGDSVRAISKIGFYVAGHFTSPGKDVAALDPSTGGAFSSFMPSGPNIGATVHDIVYDGTRVVVAGNFSTFNGTSHRGIAALTPTGGMDPDWPGTAAANDDVRSLAAIENGQNVIAGGSFTTYGSVTGLSGTARLVAGTGLPAPTFTGTASLAMNTIHKVAVP